MWKKSLLATLLAACMAWTSMPVSAEPIRIDDIDGLETALNLQRVFSAVAERTSPSVVVITNKQIRRQRDGIGDVPPAFRFFFGIPEEEQQRERRRQEVPRPVGRGSGVILRPEGYVLTNYHVIREHDILEMMMHDGTVYSTENNELEIVGIDQETDLAVVRIIGRNGQEENLQLPWLQFSDTNDLRVGDWAIAVGAPFDFDYSVTVGVVSQKGRHGMRMHAFENYIQTDASINPGNSGGPLLNIRGEIIGINNFIVTGGGFSQGNVGVGFAIDGNLARQVADAIIEQGEVIRPWLGISMQELDATLQQEFGVDQGVLVSEAMEGDPAAAAGIRAGDIIIRVGEQAVNSPRELQFAVLQFTPGDTITLRVFRDGEELDVEVVAKRRGDVAEREETPKDEDRDVLEDVGLHLEQTADQAVVVAAVASGSVADAAGLRRGDIIREANRQQVTSIDDVRTALQDSRGRVAVLYVQRRGSRFFLPLPVAE